MYSDYRIGHDERDEALRRLQDHLAAGRLDLAELDERAGKALEARTATELEALFGDLPDHGWLLAQRRPVRSTTGDLDTARDWSWLGWAIPVGVVSFIFLGGVAGLRVGLMLVLFRLWPLWLVAGLVIWGMRRRRQ